MHDPGFRTTELGRCIIRFVHFFDVLYQRVLGGNCGAAFPPLYYDDALHDVHSFLEFIEAKLASSQYLSAPMSRLIARTSIGSCSEWVRVMLSDTLLPRLSDLSGVFYEPSGAELVYAVKQLAQIQLALQCSAKIIHCPRCNGQYTAAADEPIVSICPACQSSMMFLVTTTKYCNNEGGTKRLKSVHSLVSQFCAAKTIDTKTHCLVATFHELMKCFEVDSPSAQSFMEADNLIPVTSWMICRAPSDILLRLPAQLRLFEQLLGNGAMLGEAGCYLTTFLASLGCIQKASRYLHSRAQTDPRFHAPHDQGSALRSTGH